MAILPPALMSVIAKPRQSLHLRLAVLRADRFYRYGVWLAVCGLCGGVALRLIDGDSRLAWLAGLVGVISVYAAFRRMQHLNMATRQRVANVRSSPYLIMGGGRVEFADIGISESEEAGGFAVGTFPPYVSEFFARSPRLDNRLLLNPEIEFSETASERGAFFASEDEADDKRLAQLKYLVTRGTMKSPLLNDDKFGLRMSLTQEPLTGSVYKTGYYDALVTNEAFRDEVYSEDRLLRDGGDTRVELRLHDYFPITKYRGRYYLDPLPTPEIANHVGVTTLALTSDRRLLFFRQSYNQAIGNLKIVASGSGSVNYADLRESHCGTNLVTALRFAMAREMAEEAVERTAGGIKTIIWSRRSFQERVREAMEGTIVTGFFRWVNRCGKPEFVGVTRLSAPFSQFGPDGGEVTALGAPCPVIRRMEDFAAAKQQIIQFAAKRVPEGINLSTYVCLERLCEIASLSTSNDAHERQVYDHVKSWLRLGD